MGAVGIGVSIALTALPGKTARPACSDIWTQKSRSEGSINILDSIRPGASLVLAQSVLGPYFRCDYEAAWSPEDDSAEKVYWWSVLLPNLQIWVESTDGRSVSLVKAQVPDIDQFTPIEIPNTPFRLGEVRFDDLIDCDRREPDSNSRASGVSELCTIGGFGVYHDYLFGAYEVVRTHYDTEALVKALEAVRERADPQHDVLRPLKINLLVMALPGHVPKEWVYIDWHHAFTDESSPIRQIER